MAVLKNCGSIVGPCYHRLIENSPRILTDLTFPEHISYQFYEFHINGLPKINLTHNQLIVNSLQRVHKQLQTHLDNRFSMFQTHL